MGGNALSITTRRIGKDEHRDIVKDVVSQFATACIQAAGLGQLFEKASFGDVDIVVDSGSLDRDFLKTKLGVGEVFQNHTCTSCGRGDVQIDLITCPNNNYDMTRFFYSWGDLGALLRMNFNQDGIKLSPNGLSVPVVGKGGVRLNSIVLTKDPEKAMEFLGYSSDRWNKGFANNTEIFEFISSSEFYNKGALGSSVAHYIRTGQSRGRTAYQDYLSWSRNAGLKHPDRPRIIHRVSDFFGVDVQKERQQIVGAWEAERAKKMKFSGIMVEAATGLSGKDLTQLMKNFRMTKGDGFKAWVETTEQEDIIASVKAFNGVAEPYPDLAPSTKNNPVKTTGIAPTF